jgi:hypothetical protein
MQVIAYPTHPKISSLFNFKDQRSVGQINGNESELFRLPLMQLKEVLRWRDGDDNKLTMLGGRCSGLSNRSSRAGPVRGATGMNGAYTHINNTSFHAVQVRIVCSLDGLVCALFTIRGTRGSRESTREHTWRGTREGIAPDRAADTTAATPTFHRWKLCLHLIVSQGSKNFFNSVTLHGSALSMVNDV